MKKYLITILKCLLVIGICVLIFKIHFDLTHQIYRDYHSDGSLYREMLLSKDAQGEFSIRDGYERQYYRNGRLMLKRKYKKDLLVGEVKNFSITGQPVSVISYKNSINHGRKSYYYTNGQLKVSETYRDGLFHGPFEEYYPDGQLKREGMNKNNALLYERVYDKDGQLIDEKDYR